MRIGYFDLNMIKMGERLGDLRVAVAIDLPFVP